MNTSLVGPATESMILAMQRKELLYLENTVQQPVPMLTLLDVATGENQELETMAAIALLRLNTAGKVEVLVFGKRVFIKLVSTADEAQGSTSRSVAGGKGDGVGFHRERDYVEHSPQSAAAHQERGIGTSSLRNRKEVMPTDTRDRLPMPTMQSSSHSVPATVADLKTSGSAPRIYPAQERPSLLRKANEIDYCSAGCGRVASGECDCGAPVCSAHRYGTDGHHDPAGMCGHCYDESIISNGRQA